MAIIGNTFIEAAASAIPQRYVFGLLGLFALANAFTMRICLSVAITQMVHHVPMEHIEGETCPLEPIVLSRNTTVLLMHNTTRERYNWSESTQGFLLSGFFYGFVATHVPGGLLAQKFGGKWTAGLGLLVSSAATAATPWAVIAGGSTGLFVTRIFVGLGVGGLAPAVSLMMARWVPPTERSRFSAVVFGGAQLGNLLGPYLSGLLLADGADWANVFYLFGLLSFIWFVLWSFICFDTPNEHPFISKVEREYLNDHVIGSALKRRLDPVPWAAVLRSPPLWVLVIGGIGCDSALITIGVDLPKYMSDVLKFNIKDAGAMSSLPFIAIYVTVFVFAVVCDTGIKRKWHSIGTARKIYGTVCTFGPAISIILASYSGCNRYLAVSFFILAMTTMGAFYSSIKVNAMDIAPNYAGTTSAIVNGIGGISGIVTPYLIGILTPEHTISQWRSAFWLVAGLLVFSNVVFWIWGSGEQQWWDDVYKHGYPEDWTRGKLPQRHINMEMNTAPDNKRQSDFQKLWHEVSDSPFILNWSIPGTNVEITGKPQTLD